MKHASMYAETICRHSKPGRKIWQFSPKSKFDEIGFRLNVPFYIDVIVKYFKEFPIVTLVEINKYSFFMQAPKPCISARPTFN